MITTRFRAGVVTALAAALLVQPPGAARAQGATVPAPPEFTGDAKSCAALYEPVGLTALFYKYYDPTGEAAIYNEATVTTGVPDALWRYSNARFIDFSARYKALAAKVSGPVREPGKAMGAELTKTNFPSGILVFPEKPGEKLIEMPPESVYTPEFGHNLTYCDKTHGFSPVFWYGAPDALTCAEALYMTGFEGPQFQAQAIAESKAAIQKHLRIFRGANQLQVEQQVMASAEARLKRINAGTENFNALRLEVLACRIELIPSSTRYGKGISPGGPFHFLRMFKDSQGRGYGINVIGGPLLDTPPQQSRPAWLWDIMSYTLGSSRGEYDSKAIMFDVFCDAGTIMSQEVVLLKGETLLARERRPGTLAKPRPGTYEEDMFAVICDPSKRSPEPPFATFAEVHKALEKQVAKGD